MSKTTTSQVPNKIYLPQVIYPPVLGNLKKPSGGRVKRTKTPKNNYLPNNVARK